MKTLTLTLALLAPALALESSTPRERRDTPAPAQDAFHPGSQHAFLQKLAGTWDATVVVKDPQGVEHRTPGTLITVRHTDFHTLDSFEGDCAGMKMLGHGVNGYCTVKQQYFRFWTDSMTSSPMTLYGDYDAKKRELTMTGQCFGMSGKLEPCRTVTRIQDDDHYSFAMFGAGPDGRELQHVSVEYTRRK